VILTTDHAWYWWPGWAREARPRLGKPLIHLASNTSTHHCKSVTPPTPPAIWQNLYLELHDVHSAKYSLLRARVLGTVGVGLKPKKDPDMNQKTRQALVRTVVQA